ncbi:putative hydrolase/acyltransferase (alpha/beta hydrolase superfamily) [Handroanthus impetiginosus]|uniref:Putative hydrolase/acyltransferase (Alpha/beta hydrolase superfamily) n=1 Tax=Handroanthus impetiginosus TaxID=429701 RepID=A0A2G9HWA8_9LAMI|nr:putative hydrolase/acyltransferase (alpha/beta hydrolase superfamily) [Handroanthus impetiginosus]
MFTGFKKESKRGMGSSCLSIVSLYSRFLHRTITAAGLSSQTVDIDGDTTIHFWGPPVATSKPQLVFIHGFGHLVFFGNSLPKSADRSEVFQATCIANLLEKLGICSYGGFVAYRLLAMWPERVQKMVIASSAVNVLPGDNDELLKKANVEKIEDLLMPLTASHRRKSLGFVVFRRPYIPDFVLNDFIDTRVRGGLNHPQIMSATHYKYPRNSNSEGMLHCYCFENRKEKLELLQGLAINGDDISPLSQEVLIVWGEHDQIFLLEKAFELKKYVAKFLSTNKINLFIDI